MTPLEALQAALAGEHAAVYLTGFLGAQASKSRQPALYAALLASYDAHRAARDRLTELVTDAGGTPVAAAVTYELPARTTTVAEMSDAALQVERRITETYGSLVESTSGAVRRWALVALDSSAVRQLVFRGTPEMFPASARRS